jgi:hypothetical protein
MTNEEAKEFLDNLKICISEHPIVADWLVEIADSKTENSSEKPNNSTISKMEQVETMSCAERKHRPIGAEICEEPCHYEPQTDWHYDEQDATWYPYKYKDDPNSSEKPNNSND